MRCLWEEAAAAAERERIEREDDERGGGIVQWHGDGSALGSSGEEQQGGFGVRHPGRRVLARGGLGNSGGSNAGKLMKRWFGFLWMSV